ncbi:DUF3422 family protein [Knoellia koreensis]|uniref:DUF3422 domain-containing protein n=1 Tax=Knoellia koreensis TaxID=2730921 RepID=A0A849HE48_9MICO|nr:DUF3422 domain-containing protein [Knoellia sp. DB2414S]
MEANGARGELDHPGRVPLLEELHARPAPRFGAPALVLHLALAQPAAAAVRDRGDDERQLRALISATADALDGARHHVFRRGPWEVTWESHTEFTSYTAVRPEPDAGNGSGFPSTDPFAGDAADVFPPEWEAADPATRVAAVAVAVLPLPSTPEQVVERVSAWLDPGSTLITRVLGGAAVLAGDFRADRQGYTRFVLFVPPDIGPGRVGRTVQRVVELETYRSLAMLGFVESQQLGTRLTAIDPQLLHLVSQLDEPEQPGEQLLHELLSVTAELEGLAMAHDFRFGATAAYAAIVDDRLSGLAEERFLGRQTLREFLARRYLPAIRTVTSLEERLGRMLERAGRAADLLRTKVDVERAAQNQSLLHSMDARAETQLQLQHTVEGLSVVAISYYALGLLGYLLAPVVEEAGISKVWLMAALAPLVILGTWLGMRRVRARIHDQARTPPHS